MTWFFMIMQMNQNLIIRLSGVPSDTHFLYSNWSCTSIINHWSRLGSGSSDIKFASNSSGGLSLSLFNFQDFLNVRIFGLSFIQITDWAAVGPIIFCYFGLGILGKVASELLLGPVHSIMLVSRLSEVVLVFRGFLLSPNVLLFMMSPNELCVD